MLSVIVKDTVSVIDASSVSSFYSDIINKQQGSFNIFLVAVGIIFATVIGATWWWNYKGSKAQISEEIQTGLKKYQRLFSAHNASVGKLVDERVEKRMKSLMDTVNKDLEDFKDRIELDNKTQNADLCRVFALHCSTEKSYFYSARWWMSAFECYDTINKGKFEQIAIDAFVTALGSSFKSEMLSESQMELSPDLEKRINKIPDIYTDQRNKAKKLLSQIESKTKKEQEKS